MSIQHEQADLSGSKVLVVDDNQFHAAFLREMLSDAKASVVTASSGAEALELLKSQHDFTCVLLDTQMPGMDGFEVAEKTRSMPFPELHVLPIIGMLSRENKTDHDKVFAVGMNGVLTKPIFPTALYEEVLRLRHMTFLGQQGNRESLKGKSAYVLVKTGELAEVIVRSLESNGLSVVRCNEFKDVLEMANENRRFDFAFAEWDEDAEPDMELARQVTLFAQNTFRHLIAVTPDWSTIESQALGLGIDAYINTSPTDMDMLNVLLKVMLDDELKARDTSEDFKGVRILIADDNSTNAMVMQNAVEMFGATADIALSGKEALEMLTNAPERHYQMAFLDIFMPDMMGFDVAEQFRRLEREDAFTLPLIGISGNAGTQLVEKAIASGMNAMMLKPITRKSQLATMNIFLKEENYSKLLASRMQKRLTEINKDLSVSKYKADIVSFLVSHHDLSEIINYTAEHLLVTADCRRVILYRAEDGRTREWLAPGESACPKLDGCPVIHGADSNQGCLCGGKTYLCEISASGKPYGRLAVQYLNHERTLGNQLLHEAAGIITMAVERAQAEEKQREMMEMLQTKTRETTAAHELVMGMLNSITTPFFVKDIKDDFRYLMCNEAFASAIQLPKESIIGHTDMELFPPEMANGVRADDQKAVKNAKRFSRAFDVNDLWVWLDNRIYDETKQVFTDKNDRHLLLCMARDVTEERYEMVRTKFKSDIMAFLSRHVDCDAILAYVAMQLQKVTDSDFIMLHSADGNHREWLRDGGQKICDYCRECPIANSEGAQFDSEHIASLTDVGECAGGRLPAPCRAKSLISHQILFQGKVWGQLAIHYSKPVESFSKGTRQLLQIAADVMTATLEREEYITHIKMERDNALAAEKAKNFFFATVSHDIRTPLNAIVGFSELLKGGVEDAQTRDTYLDAIRLSSKTLETLITDVLDLSKLEADKMKFFYEMIDVSKLLDGVCLLFEQKARAKGIALAKTSDDVPVVSIDQHRVRQILLNLVGNAVKFTEHGSVTVRSSFKRITSTLGTLMFIIADTGVGIQKDDLENIFKPFSQVSRAEQVNGTGMGLAVCNQLLLRMNGRMTVASDVGKGSVFTVELNDVAFKSEEAKGDVEGAAGVVRDVAVRRTKGLPRLLLVDDSKVNLMVLKAMCSKIGIKEIVLAEDGLKALEALERHPVDIVLTDIWMPNLRGEELVARIREDERFKDLPVFAVTADVDVMKTYAQQGFSGILLKPISVDKIMASLKEFADDL